MIEIVNNEVDVLIWKGLSEKRAILYSLSQWYDIHKEETHKILSQFQFIHLHWKPTTLSLSISVSSTHI